MWIDLYRREGRRWSQAPKAKVDSEGEDKALSSRSSRLGYRGVEVRAGCLLQPCPFGVSMNFVDPLSPLARYN